MDEKNVDFPCPNGAIKKIIPFGESMRFFNNTLSSS